MDKKQVNKLEDMLIETSQTEKPREKKNAKQSKTEESIQELCTITKVQHMCNGNTGRRRKKVTEEIIEGILDTNFPK